jgi:hypothetical protein
MTARVLDARHLWLASVAWLLACCGYLVGAYAMLANRRYAVAGFVFLFGCCSPAPPARRAAAAGAGAGLARRDGAGELQARPARAAARRLDTVRSRCRCSLAMWCALLVLSFARRFVWIARGTHPNNPAVPVAGSVKEAEAFDARELMVGRPARQHAPGGALWREQAAISDVHRVAPPSTSCRGATSSATRADGIRRRHAPRALGVQPRRHALPWLTLAEQRAAGTLGVLGQRPSRAAAAVGKGMLATDDAIYQYDEEAGRILPRARLPAAST